LRRFLRWALLGLVVAFALLQLKQVEHTNPAVQSEIDAPPEVRAILRRSCYDCHSHETRWPWYSYVAPTSWFVADHVEHARGDLNFSDWPRFDFEEQEHALEEIHEQISKGEMPLASYLLVHRDARLSEADKATLLRWAAAPTAISAPAP
jgi:hypothetical protein